LAVAGVSFFEASLDETTPIGRHEVTEFSVQNLTDFRQKVGSNETSKVFAVLRMGTVQRFDKREVSDVFATVPSNLWSGPADIRLELRMIRNHLVDTVFRYVPEKRTRCVEDGGEVSGSALAHRYHHAPVESVPVHVTDDRVEADHLDEFRHDLRSRCRKGIFHRFADGLECKEVLFALALCYFVYELPVQEPHEQFGAVYERLGRAKKVPTHKSNLPTDRSKL